MSLRERTKVMTDQPFGSAGAGATYILQPDSPLLMLPAELRIMIWEHLLGNQYIHFSLMGRMLRDRKLRGSACTAQIWKETRPLTPVNMGSRRPVFSRSNQPLSSSRSWGLGNVLRTSKQIYHETIGPLYETNTFLFLEPLHINMLSAAIPDPHWKRIRAITLCACIPPYCGIGRQRQPKTWRGQLVKPGGKPSLAWTDLRDTLYTLPDLRSFEIFALEPRVHSYAQYSLDPVVLCRTLKHYLTKGDCASNLKNFTIYLPMVRRRLLGSNGTQATWERDPTALNNQQVMKFRSGLKKKGIKCEISVGGIISFS